MGQFAEAGMTGSDDAAPGSTDAQAGPDPAATCLMAGMLTLPAAAVPVSDSLHGSGYTLLCAEKIPRNTPQKTCFTLQ